jgi:hypothetical protein
MAVDQEKTGLTLRGKLSAKESAEARRALQSRVTLLRYFVRWGYAVIFAALLLWMTVDMAVSHTRVDWSGFILIWLIVAAVFAWLIFRARSSAAKALARHNANAPDRFILTAAGIEAESTDGVRFSVPWTAYAGWREGNRVVFLLFPEKERVQLLPKEDLSATALDTLRGTLTSALGPAKTK